MSRPFKPDDAGFSLIELLVASLISLVILAIGGGLLTSAIRTQQSISSAADATNLGQLIARSVESGVRNASAVTVVPGPVAGSQLLLARTADGGGTLTWSCQAWYYTPASGGAIYTIRTSPATTIPTPSGVPTGWVLIGDGLTTVDPTAAVNVFSAPSGRVDLKFNTTNGLRHSVLVQTSIYLRRAATESAPCF